MAEVPIIKSPHAYDPALQLTDQERHDRYHKRIDSTIKPYTVIDTLKKVFHRSFESDLAEHVSTFPDEFQADPSSWNLSRAYVNSLRLIRSESVFLQKPHDFCVDIACEAHIKLIEINKANPWMKKASNFSRKVWLRYSFDMTPCRLTCGFAGVILDENETLLAKDEIGIPVDRYLVPVLRDEDYEYLATQIRSRYFRGVMFKDVAIDPVQWLLGRDLTLRFADFGEENTMGEYFFDFGSATLVVPKTSEVFSDAEINPGTIVLDRSILSEPAKRSSTLAHELTHEYTGRFFFLLQKMHGVEYSSYICKRFDRSLENKASPIETLEVQANKFPRFLMIPHGTGKKRAEQLLKSYGGQRTLSNIRRLVDDMAAHYGTTKTMARSRLVDFGFNEARGICQNVDGKPVPSYMSRLPRNQSYIIDEESALREYIDNPAFRRLIDSGIYEYVEGHYCLCSDKYIVRDAAGVPHLTKTAHEEMAACCLVFETAYKSTAEAFPGVKLRKSNNGGLKSKKRWDENTCTFDSADARELRRQIQREMAQRAKLTMSFNQMTDELIRSNGSSNYKLAEATGLSRDTIKDMRNDPNKVFSIRSIVAVCIALHLPVEISDEYIRISPSKFLETEEMYAYRFALRNWYMLSVAEVNSRLSRMGIRPLTNLFADEEQAQAM